MYLCGRLGLHLSTELSLVVDLLHLPIQGFGLDSGSRVGVRWHVGREPMAQDCSGVRTQGVCHHLNPCALQTKREVTSLTVPWMVWAPHFLFQLKWKLKVPE